MHLSTGRSMIQTRNQKGYLGGTREKPRNWLDRTQAKIERKTTVEESRDVDYDIG